MKYSFFLLAGLSSILFSCSTGKTFEAERVLSQKHYDSLLIQLAPYVVKKPDAMAYKERFELSSRPFYKNYVSLTSGKIRYYLKTDTVEFFTYEYQDKASLYEHYRTFGGYIKRNPEDGKIELLNLLYQTPRCTRDELEAKAQVLFKEMITSGNVDKYIGNKGLVYVPNEDIYYDTRRNRWDYTENSKWRFLQEARELAGPGRLDSIN
ncbi:MAG: hypothetical protein KF725_00615 [Cyclobacteriaceae bacterium]|nr:hypothetical protein [Cyclobacteriaceae bacterium]UYN87036.1 MAG: hypothetical protein KIT51_01790 [Cyclobacteriaceae bacterium]